MTSLDDSFRRYGLILSGCVEVEVEVQVEVAAAAAAAAWCGISGHDSSMVVRCVSERLNVKAPPSATGLSGLASDDEAEWPRLCSRAWPRCTWPCALALTMVVVLDTRGVTKACQV